MASASTGGGGSGFERVFETLDEGILYAVSVFTDEQDLLSNETTVSVSIVRGGDDDSNRVYHIGYDYCGPENPFTWNGFFEVKSGDRFKVIVRGNIDPIFRIQHQMITKRPGNIVQEVLGAVTNPTRSR